MFSSVLETRSDHELRIVSVEKGSEKGHERGWGEGQNRDNRTSVHTAPSIAPLSSRVHCGNARKRGKKDPCSAHGPNRPALVTRAV